MGRIWPGYWPADQAFVINTPLSGALLIATGDRPEGWEAVPPALLPPVLQGRAYFRRGPIEGASRPFIIGFPLGGGRTAMMVNAKPEPVETAALLFHEQFHDYQSPAFRGRISQFIAPAAVADRVDFAATAEVERKMLAAAIMAGPTRRGLLRDYFAVRREREHSVPADVRRAERGFERSEGVATYVEHRAQIATFGGAPLPKRLVDGLLKPLPNRGSFTTIWFRSRSYSTGAALAYLLSQEDPTDWQKAIENGGDPASLLGMRLDEPPDPAAAARAARLLYGHADLVRSFAPAIREGEQREIKSVEDFMRLSPYAVTIVMPHSPAPRRQGSTFASRDMTMISPTVLALRMATSFSLTEDNMRLTVRGRPVLSDTGRTCARVTVLLDAAPAVEKLGQIPIGSQSFEDLRIASQALDLEIDGPSSVVVEANRTTITLPGPGCAAGVPPPPPR